MIGTQEPESILCFIQPCITGMQIAQVGKGSIRTNGSQPCIEYGESFHRRVYGRVENEVAGAQSGGQRVDAKVQNTETRHACSCSEAYRVGRSETFLLVRKHLQWNGAGRSGG